MEQFWILGDVHAYFGIVPFSFQKQGTVPKDALKRSVSKHFSSHFGVGTKDASAEAFGSLSSCSPAV
jgi:hypothetical protein